MWHGFLVGLGDSLRARFFGGMRRVRENVVFGEEVVR